MLIRVFYRVGRFKIEESYGFFYDNFEFVFDDVYGERDFFIYLKWFYNLFVIYVGFYFLVLIVKRYVNN